MKPRQSLDWVIDVESKCEDLDFAISGVDCWPIVRNTLLSILAPKMTKKASGLKHFFSRASLFFSSLISINLISKHKVFILSDKKYAAEISGAIYLKDTHVLIERARKEGLSSIVALQGENVDENTLNHKNCFSIYAILFLAALVSKCYWLVVFFPGLSSYIDNISKNLGSVRNFEEISCSLPMIEKKIKKNIIFCFIAYKLLLSLLQRVNPERAYVVCYYSLLGMALSAACHTLQIPLADIQHGVAGRNMRSYSRWTSCPSNGYSTLPDLFLTWTPYDCVAIKEWAQITSKHNCEVSGCLWRDYFLSEGLVDVSAAEWESTLSGLASFDKIILITMQTTILNPLLLDAIRDNRFNRFVFLIRAHPDFAFENDFLLEVRGKSNVLIDAPTKMPIHLVLKVVDLHVTEWSGAVIDAYLEGVPSLVLSENALDYFEDYIAGGTVSYARNRSDLIDALFCL